MNRRHSGSLMNPAVHSAFSPHAGVPVVYALLAAIVFAYAHVSGFDFVDFDDYAYVYQNTRVGEGLSLSGLAWAMTAVHAANWHPLTWASHMLDVTLFGMWPGGHHLTSVLIHTLTTWLMVKTLWELTGRFWPSVLVAALFGLHPLHVESVAWVSERKDVLCAFFWMLSLQAYGRWAKTGNRRWYLALLGYFLLALTSKPMAVTLPFVLLLLDHWPLGRWQPGRRQWLVIEKAPLFAMAAASSIITFFVQAGQGAVGTLDACPLPHRLTNVMVAYVGYLQKTVWPADLTFFYPYPSEPQWGGAIAALALMAAATVVAWRVRRRRPFVIVGWLWFVGTLVPVIGIVQVGSQALADRYTYIPLTGVFIVAAWWLAETAQRSIAWKSAVAVAAVAVLVVLAMLTRHQTWFWRDTITLAERALAVTKDNHVAHVVAGKALKEQGRLAEAKTHLVKAIDINPRKVDAVLLFGALLEEEGQVDKALGLYRLALTISPIHAHYPLGKIYMAGGKTDLAHWHLQQALRLQPKMAVAHNDFGLLLVAQGKLKAAIYHFEQALAEHRSLAEAKDNLALALGLRERQLRERQDLERLAARDPADSDTLLRLAAYYRNDEEPQRAAERFGHVLSLAPDSLPAIEGLAATMAAMGRHDDALSYLRRWAELVPADPKPCYDTARIYAYRQDHNQALEWLAMAAQRGFARWDQLALDPAFTGLVADPRLAELRGAALPQM